MSVSVHAQPTDVWPSLGRCCAFARHRKPGAETGLPSVHRRTSSRRRKVLRAVGRRPQRENLVHGSSDLNATLRRGIKGGLLRFGRHGKSVCSDSDGQEDGELRRATVVTHVGCAFQRFSSAFICACSSPQVATSEEGHATEPKAGLDTPPRPDEDALLVGSPTFFIAPRRAIFICKTPVPRTADQCTRWFFVLVPEVLWRGVPRGGRAVSPRSPLSRHTPTTPLRCER